MPLRNSCHARASGSATGAEDATGQSHYVIRDGNDGSGAAGQITRWVAAKFVPQQVGDVTVYDLTR